MMLGVYKNRGMSAVNSNLYYSLACMRTLRSAACATLVLHVLTVTASQTDPTWRQAVAPARIASNIYYVGTAGPRQRVR